MNPPPPPLPTRRSFLATAAAALPAFVFAETFPTLPARGLCAHRGAMTSHPENTLEAFAEAIRLGAAMIEFDVQLTRDGAMVLMHDATVDRTTDGTGKVSELTLAEIRKLDAGSKKAPEFAGVRVPTFSETLAMMPPHVWLNCHLKGGAEVGRAAALEIARQRRDGQAFLAAQTDAVNAACEAVPTVLICNMERQKAAADYVDGTIAMKADFIQLPGRGEIDPRHVELLKAAGVRINYFRADTPDIARSLFAAGVDFPLVDDLAAFTPLAEELGLLNRAGA
ncbi:MAG TPA: glycerophosphodiester phosphodiesterase family protein [Bacteroidia bacterium]|nr:glycerophosphodiester phosphodiesterase family protein [Bacteroidia bacterium]